MIAKRTGWPRVRRNIYLVAIHNRPAPAATKSRPRITPRASSPPPAASATTIIVSPSSSIAVERICVAVRCTEPNLRPAARARQSGARRLPVAAVGGVAVGVDDHAARALGEDGLDRLAEHRAAGPCGQ